MFTVIAITDILKNGSYLIFTDSAKKVLEEAYNAPNIKQTHYVDGLVSRKKQIITTLLEQLS